MPDEVAIFQQIPRRADPLDTRRKLNVHKTFRKYPGRLLKVLCTFNLRPLSVQGKAFIKFFEALENGPQNIFRDIAK